MAAFVKKLVTGYVPICGHPRTSKEYGELGENLFSKLDCAGGDFTIHPFYERVEDTWLWKMLNDPKNPMGEVSHSVADNPAKNSLAYHCVQHQKFGWLLKAHMTGKPADTYVWMDYGIGHVPGVTPAVVNEFMASVKPDDFAIPGCWDDRGLVINDYFPCWRFCGGLMVVPASWVGALYLTMKKVVRKHVEKTRNVTWEVNSVASAEQYFRPHLRWYYADHDQTMFTNYGATNVCVPGKADAYAPVQPREEASD